MGEMGEMYLMLGAVVEVPRASRWKVRDKQASYGRKGELRGEVRTGDVGREAVCVEGGIVATSWSSLLSRPLPWRSLGVFEECVTAECPDDCCVP